MISKSSLKDLLPISLLKWQKKVRMQFYASRAYRHLFMSKRVAKLRKAARIKVLFIAFAPSMWKVDSLFRAMLAHPKFEVELLLAPNITISDSTERAKVLENLRIFFQQKGYNYVEWCDINGNCQFERIPKEYDIIFYPQPWPGILPQNLDFEHNLGRLLINCEYAFHSGNQNWAYNKWLQNSSWIDLYENESTHQLSCKQKDNKGINSVVTGLPIMDEFSRQNYHSPWKAQNNSCKKIIWAPHWTICDQSSSLPSYSHFLEMADYMLELAQHNTERLQFVFKPHPTLKRELYKHPEWGKERTELYYSAWKEGENTQLEDGEYVDLFMTSDAMIHDSSSFCCEYMYTGKPVLFMAKNEKLQTSLLNEMAYSAFYAQYIGHSLDDIKQFIDKTVFGTEDPKQKERAQFIKKYLIPPNGKTSAENIIQAILGQ